MSATPTSPRPSTYASGTVSLRSLLEPQRIEQVTSPHELRATGFEPLDTVLSGGLAPEELVVVGGRPGIGKSITVVQWARNLAASGRRVLIAAYEHSELLVAAQLLLIELGEASTGPMETVAARTAVDTLIAGRRGWSPTIESDPLLRQAAHRLASYSDNLIVLDRVGRSAGFDLIRRATIEGAVDVVVVDHLMKVGGEAGRTAAMCKELAVETSATILAATTVTDEGVGVRRLRPTHFEDASMVGHEADVEIALNQKLHAVSRSHSAYDPVRAEEFRSLVVFTLEKNRRGLAGIDIEFSRDFAHRRFHPHGRFVAERLVDSIQTIE